MEGPKDGFDNVEFTRQIHFSSTDTAESEPNHDFDCLSWPYSWPQGFRHHGGGGGAIYEPNVAYRPVPGRQEAVLKASARGPDCRRSLVQRSPDRQAYLSHRGPTG